jgi:hypothetical protein
LFQDNLGQLLIDAITVPTPTTKHATMVRALLIHSVEFIKECPQVKKGRTYSLMISVKRKISVLTLFNESRYKTLFCFGRISTAIQWFALR